MSLVPFAIRICTLRALQAALPASVEVLDSPQEPLTLLDIDAPRPIIAIYIGSVLTKYEGRNIFGGTSNLALSIQTMLPETFVFRLIAGGEITIDTRRQGAKTALDVLWRMAVVALNSGIEPWVALWREFVIAIPALHNNSYLIERQGVRVTAREATIDCEPLHEPVPGGAPKYAWARVMEMMRADDKGDSLSLLADWLESEIRNSADRPQTTRDAAYLGLPQYVAGAIRLEPTVDSVGDTHGEFFAEAPGDPEYS
jgi:hypothetical protein